MRNRGSTLLATLAVFAALAALGAAPSALAGAADPSDLRVTNGSAWHAANNFSLAWERSGSDPAVIAYYLRDAAGTIYPEVRAAWLSDHLENVRVPAPGKYTLTLWLEDARGGHGSTAQTSLWFDSQRPAPVRATPRDGWLPGGEPAVVRIEHPASPLPISGIRGYAVSVEQGSGALPCAGPDQCSEAETDRGGGIGDDTISLGILPEGNSTVRVVAVSGSGIRSEAAENTVLRVDASRPEVTLSGVPSGWASGPVRLLARASDPFSGMADSGPNGPFTAIAADGAAPTVATGDTVAATVSGAGVHQVAYFARDAVGNGGAGEGSPAPAPHAVVRIDEDGPRVVFAKFQDPADPERIEATLTDTQSGPDAGRGAISVRPEGSRQQFVPLPTSVSAGRLIARWSSDDFPPGSYEFRATGFDAAGNPGLSDRRADGTRMVLANPLKTPTAVRAGFGGRELIWHRCVRRSAGRHCRREVIESFARRPPTRTIPYGHGAWFGGRLATEAGAPIGAATLQIVESFDPGANRRQRVTAVATAADGTFLTRLGAGPTRQVEAVFAGTRVLTRASGRSVALEVLSGVRLHASAATAAVGGAPVVFSGRVGALGASIPTSGRPVGLQFRLPGVPWTEFRTVQTDGLGRFRFPYSFSDDDSRGIRFQFRAVCPAQDGWPYEPGTSRPVAVTGR